MTLNRVFGGLLLALLGAAPASAAELVAAYSVDVGPMTVLTVKWSAAIEGGAVRSQAVLKTKGVSSVFSEYNARAEGHGRIDGDAVRPVQFRLVRLKEDKRKELSLSWNGDAMTANIPASKDPEVQARVERAISAGTSDPFTAILKLAARGGSPCPSTFRVFDGRDVFELAFTERGTGRNKGEGAYRGEVQLCEVTWHPIAGKSAERGDPDDSYRIAFAPVPGIEDGKPFWLPVSISGKVKGLGFEAYATKIAVDGAEIAGKTDGD